MTSVARVFHDRRNGLADLPVGNAVRRTRPDRDFGEWCTPVDDRSTQAFDLRVSGLIPASRCTLVDRINVASDGRLPGELRGAIAALGNFDGLHMGHQEVIARAVALARQRNVPAVVATFDPHPVRHFNPGSANFALTTFDQRRRVLSGMGVAAVIAFAFDDALAKITPAAFVHGYLSQLGGVVTGAGFAFGHRRSGCVELLAGLARDRGIVSDAIGPVVLGKEMVSSTRIRAALRDGNCAEATRLLTRPFAVQGFIHSGQRRDKTRGPSKVSLELRDYLRPQCGLYAVRALTEDGEVFRGKARLDAPSKFDPQPPLELFLTGLAEPDAGRQLTVELIAHRHVEVGCCDDLLPDRCSSGRSQSAPIRNSLI